MNACIQALSRRAAPAKSVYQAMKNPMSKFSTFVTVTALAAVIGPSLAFAQSVPSGSFDCVIEPSEIVDLGSAVSGLIREVHADRSDLVKEGQSLVVLESDAEEASVKLAAARASLETGIRLREADLALSHSTQTRSNKLMKNAAISEQDMDKVRTDVRVAELNLDQERENKRIAGLELQKAMALLQQRNIRSPVSGVVMERFKAAGEHVSDDPIMRIAQLDPLHVEIILPASELGRIKEGMDAVVSPVVGDDADYFAIVERVDRVVDTASGTFGVRLSLPNPDYAITAGLRCNLSFLPLKDTASKSGTSPLARAQVN